MLTEGPGGLDIGRTRTGFGVRERVAKAWLDTRRDFVWITREVRDFAEFRGCGRLRAHRQQECRLERWQSGPLQELIKKAHQIYKLYERRDEAKVKKGTGEDNVTIFTTPNRKKCAGRPKTKEKGVATSTVVGMKSTCQL